MEDAKNIYGAGMTKEEQEQLRNFYHERISAATYLTPSNDPNLMAEIEARIKRAIPSLRILQACRRTDMPPIASDDIMDSGLKLLEEVEG